MDTRQAFEHFLATETPHIELTEFLVNLGITAALAFALSLLYRYLGHSISNRKSFANNLIIIAVTTMVIITVVKSSLALSLGLVGALSIVRFRTAIKEPEELAYIFICIAIGLGMGAGQRAVIVAGFGVLSLLIWAISLGKKRSKDQRMHLMMHAEEKIENLLEQAVEILDQTSSGANLRRVDESQEGQQIDFFVGFENYKKFAEARQRLGAISSKLRLTFLENSLL